MTPVVSGLVAQYRARAEDARIRADNTPDESARRSLLQIADTWERMAKWEEQHHPQRKDPEAAPPEPPKPCT